jgi:predicted RNA-binding protein
MKYWIIVASKDHLQRGLDGGFIQANHGKAGPLKRMKPDDWVVFYSPKLVYEKPEKYQHFTAIGQIADDRIYQHDMGGGFVPFRRNVRFLPARDIPIQPLIDALTFIQDKSHWGAPFRFGTLQIPEGDFKLIAREMLGDEQYQSLWGEK